jgi:hypothetical protein
MAAAASAGANRTERRLRELAAQVLAEAEETDAAEDALLGEARGDELPAELADPVTRRERIAAALAQLEAERRAAEQEKQQAGDAYLEQAAAGRPPRGGRPAGADVRAAELALERVTAAQQAKIDEWDRRNAASIAAAGTGLRNPPRRPAGEYARAREAAARLERAQERAARRAAAREAARKGPGPVANITDPDSRLMPVRGGGFVQGFNAQAAHSADGLCLGGLVTAATTDYASFAPLLDQVAAAAGTLGAAAGLVLADAGYLSEANLTCAGPGRLIAAGGRRTLAAVAAGTASPGRRADGRALSPRAAAMAARLAAAPGAAAYRLRGPIAETPFASRKHNRGFRAFSMRGLARASGEWAFQGITDNLLKIHAAGWQPA